MNIIIIIIISNNSSSSSNSSTSSSSGNISSISSSCCFNEYITCIKFCLSFDNKYQNFFYSLSAVFCNISSVCTDLV